MDWIVSIAVSVALLLLGWANGLPEREPAPPEAAQEQREMHPDAAARDGYGQEP